MEKIQLEKPIDLNEVLAFATEKHNGQFRDNGEPYIIHPIRVAELIKQYKPSKNQEILLAASLLHDTLEDTYTSMRELEDHFGKVVASLVEELTTASFVPKLIGKATYLSLKMQNMTSYALSIKLADRLDNIRDLKHSSTEKKIRTINDTKYIIDYLEKNKVLTESQKTFISLIKQEIEIASVK